MAQLYRRPLHGETLKGIQECKVLHASDGIQLN